MAVNKIIVRTYVRPVETVRKNFTQLCKYAFIHEKNFEKFDTIASGSRMEWHGRGERLGEADILAEWEWDMIEIRLSNSVNCKSTYTVCEVRVEVSCFMVRGSVEVEVERGGALHHTSPHLTKGGGPPLLLLCSAQHSGAVEDIKSPVWSSLCFLRRYELSIACQWRRSAAHRLRKKLAHMHRTIQYSTV